MAFPTYQSSNTATGAGSATVTRPTSLAVGDIMIGWAVSNNATHPSAPTGAWTLIDSSTAGSTSAASFYKIADASDVIAANFTFTSGGNIYAAVIRITSDNPAANPIDQHGIGNGFSGTPTVTTLTPTTNSGLFLILGGWSDANSHTASGYNMATDSPTFTEAFDTGGSFGVAMAYGRRFTLTATGNITYALATATNGGFYYIQALNIVPLVPAPLSISLSINLPARPVVALTSPLSMALSVNASTTSIDSNGISNMQKSATTIWANTPKS